jgi:bacteriorhodopsin
MRNRIMMIQRCDWVIITPALLLELELTTGLPLSDIIAIIFFDEVMIITGLVGVLVVSSYKASFCHQIRVLASVLFCLIADPP